MNREQWMERAIEILTDEIFYEDTVPKIQVSCGFPSRRAVVAKNRVIGQCWNKRASEDGETYTILISPLLKDGIEVLGVLVHEVLHAILPFGTGHKAPFKHAMVRIGLEGKPTATTAGAELEEKFKHWIATGRLAEYPHVALNASGMERERKKQTTRLIKVECPSCGCLARMTMKWLLDPGTPMCGCGTEMEAAV